MYYITGDQAFANEMQFELNNKGGVPTNKYNAAGWALRVITVHCRW